MVHRLLKWINSALTPTLGLRLVRLREPPLDPNYRFQFPGFDLRMTSVTGRISGAKAPYPPGHLSVLTEDLALLIDKAEFSGKRVLEIGPKFGYHTAWIDRELAPGFLQLLDLADDVDHGYVDEIHCPHNIRYENILADSTLADSEPFDLIVCTGVLYHNVEPFRLLNKLWTLSRPGALMVLESTITQLERDLSASDAVMELRWHGTRKGDYLLPSKSAVIAMLAMTGWNDITWFADFNTIEGGMLLTCRKSEARPSSYHGTSFGGLS